MKAAELGHVQALEILKKCKADSTLRDKEGKGEFQLKIKSFQSELSKIYSLIKIRCFILLPFGAYKSS